jgi:hypothetical protein
VTKEREKILQSIFGKSFSIFSTHFYSKSDAGKQIFFLNSKLFDDKKEKNKIHLGFCAVQLGVENLKYSTECIESFPFKPNLQKIHHPKSST